MREEKGRVVVAVAIVVVEVVVVVVVVGCTVMELSKIDRCVSKIQRWRVYKKEKLTQKD